MFTTSMGFSFFALMRMTMTIVILNMMNMRVVVIYKITLI